MTPVPREAVIGFDRRAADYERGRPGYPARGWRRALDATGRFAPLTERVVPHPVEVDVETLAARVASLSYIALLPPTRRQRLLDAVRDLVTEPGIVKVNGALITPYRTHVFSGRALPAPA
jgi:hypothetical protein